MATNTVDGMLPGPSTRARLTPASPEARRRTAKSKLALAALFAACALPANADVYPATVAYASPITNQIYPSIPAVGQATAGSYCPLLGNGVVSCSYAGTGTQDGSPIFNVQVFYPDGTSYTAWFPILVQYLCSDGGYLVTYNTCFGAAAAPPASPPPPPPPPPKVVAIDPGHGSGCPANGMRAGAIGATNFSASDPPLGRLKEDELTVAIALEVRRLMPAAKYRVVLTKTDVKSCPSFVDRGRIASNAGAKIFVSVHINAPGLLTGTSTYYNSTKSGSFNFAQEIAYQVSSNMGINNRGVTVNDEFAVLKPTVTQMDAVLVEVARLSGSDEIALHTYGSSTRAATGISNALIATLGN